MSFSFLIFPDLEKCFSVGRKASQRCPPAFGLGNLSGDHPMISGSVQLPVFGIHCLASFAILLLGGCDSRQQPFRRFDLADKGVGSCIQDCLTCLRPPTEHDHVQVVTDTPQAETTSITVIMDKEQKRTNLCWSLNNSQLRISLPPSW